MTTNRIAIALAIALFACSVTSAATLVDFKPLPSSPMMPEFLFTGPPLSPSFQNGPGAQSNGDGALPVPAQTPGGLGAEAPFLIPAVVGSSLNAASTEFFDTTLSFTGLVASAPAQNFFGTHVQPLGNGAFTLSSTTGVNLLSGTIGNATIVGAGTSGAVLSSATVNYTSGLIYNALVSSGADPNGNDMSFSMVDVNPGFVIGGNGFLADFSANGTGLFSYNPIPEPTTATLVMLGLLGLCGLRRR